MDPQAQPAARKPVLGIFEAKVDAAGRLKLPVKFRAYLGGEPVVTTTLDEKVARIYPRSSWDAIEHKLAESKNPTAAAKIHFNASRYGEEGELDSAGRVLIPTILRRRLRLENETVYLECFKNAITVYSKDEFDARIKAADETREQDLATLQLEGIE